MTELKTKVNDTNVKAYIDSLDNELRKADCLTMLKLMERVTGESAKMWGTSIVGFGSYHYKYKSGREGDWFLAGFAPRKQDFTIYVMPGFSDYPKLMDKLGTFKTGKSCLYVKKLEDVDLAVLEELVRQSVQYMRETYNS